MISVLPSYAEFEACDSCRVFVVLVTGVPGSGTTEMAQQLRQWGHDAVHAGADAQLCGWFDRDGERVQRPVTRGPVWSGSHHCRWDADQLDEMIDAAGRSGVQTWWLCGRAANALDVADRFDVCLLLEVDAETIASRLDDASRRHAFGEASDILAAAKAGHLPFLAQWRRHGAITVDASQHIEDSAGDALLAVAQATLYRTSRWSGC